MQRKVSGDGTYSLFGVFLLGDFLVGFGQVDKYSNLLSVSGQEQYCGIFIDMSL